MSDADTKKPQDLETLLHAVRRRLFWLTVAVLFLALPMFGVIAVMFGYLADWHAKEGLLVGGAVCGAAVLGFCVGLVAARKA